MPASMMGTEIALALILMIASVGGDPTSCPKPTDIQTDYVKKNFDAKKFQGVFYELAYHDYTQPIGLCGCQRSVKSYHADSNFIFDNFTLYCAETNQFNNLTFNLTGYVKGHMVGHWPFLSSVDFPNTVVAVGVNNKTGGYDWTIEFQCVELFSKIVFTGINFYNKNRLAPRTELQGMLDIARKQGLGYWMDHGLKVTIVDHTNCTYPPVPKSVIDNIGYYNHSPIDING